MREKSAKINSLGIDLNLRKSCFHSYLQPNKEILEGRFYEGTVDDENMRKCACSKYSLENDRDNFSHKVGGNHIALYGWETPGTTANTREDTGSRIEILLVTSVRCRDVGLVTEPVTNFGFPSSQVKQQRNIFLSHTLYVCGFWLVIKQRSEVSLVKKWWCVRVCSIHSLTLTLVRFFGKLEMTKVVIICYLQQSACEHV